MQQCYRSKLHKNPFYWPQAAGPERRLSKCRLDSMLGVPSQQLKSVRKQRQDGSQAVLGAGRAAGEVHDQRVACDAADAASKCSKGCLLRAAKSNLFGNAGNEAIADHKCGFGSHVALRKTSATCRKYQVGMLSGASQ